MIRSRQFRDRLGDLLGSAAFVVLLVLAGCSSAATQDQATTAAASGSEPTSDLTDGPAPADDGGRCGQTAAAIVDRFEAFLAPFADLSPVEFLSLEEPVGIDDFRTDVGSEVVAGANVGCDPTSLDSALRDELQDLSGRGPLVDHLAASILGAEPIPAAGAPAALSELTIGPDDVLPSALATLAPSATLTLAAGVYEVAEPLVTTTELTIVGAGSADTIIRSSATDAALAVADGSLELQQLTVEHVGGEVASVVISFARPLHLDNVRLAGARTDSDGGGGTGLVVTDVVSTADGASSVAGATIMISESELVDNEVAGAAISADVAITVAGSRFGDNGVCGLCLFDAVRGTVTGTTFEGNTIGLQVSDSASPVVTGSSATGNGVGIVVGDSSMPELAGNQIAENTEAGIELQGESTAEVRTNTIAAHPVAIVVNGAAAPTIDTNTLDGGAVGIQLGGSSRGTVTGNRLTNVEAGLVAADATTATFSGNQINGGRVGLEANGTAAPVFEDNTIDGVTLAGLVYLDSAAGVARRNSFRGPMTVGVQVGDDATPLLDELDVAFVVDGADESGATSAAGASTAPPVGMLLAEQSAATVTNATVSDFLIGVQVSGAAQPVVSTTTIDGGELESVGLLYGESSSGTAEGNDLINHLIGVQVGGTAAPVLVANNVDAAAQASYLLTGSASPTLDGNGCTGAVPGIVLLEAAVPELGENDCPIDAG